ncbi:MAG: chromate efflux transporter [Deltaproteobacteria bacterium]|nr:chromate efflux transporter [Deltaproteobacteria bacterium]
MPLTPLKHDPLLFAGKLFLAFLRLGLTAFGGPAMISYIRDLAVKKNGWLTEESFRQGVSVCQAIPGATAMQVAAYVGLRSGGFFGALAAYVGFGLPAFLLMVILAAFYQSAHDLAAVVSIFKGLQVVVIAMVANATLNFGRSTIKIWQDILLGLGVSGFLVMGGNPILAILSSALLGIFLYQKMEGRQQGTPGEFPAITFRSLKIPLLLTLALLAGMLILFYVDRQLFALAMVMAKVDFFAFGGGYGSLPLMFNEVVGVKHWLDSRTFMDGIALGQVTPGPIVITAAFVGSIMSGLPGAVVGTVSIFTPSLIMLTAVIPYFDRIQGNAVFQRAMHGVLVSFVGLLLSVTIRFILAVQWDVYQLLIAALAFLALRMKVDILWVVCVGGGIAALLL